MAEPRFKAGQTVRVSSTAKLRDVARGELMEIVRALPNEGWAPRYRVREVRTGMERAMEEGDLEGVGG